MINVQSWLRRLQEPQNRRYINAGSNIAYPLAGLVGLLSGASWGIGLFWATVVLAVGSTWYHLKENEGYQARRDAQLADEIGMYLVLVVLTGAVSGVQPVLILPFALVLALLAPWVPSAWGVPVLVGGLMLAAIYQGIALQFLPALFVMVVATLVRAKDEERVIHGNGLLHSLWHVLSAASIALAASMIF